MDDNRQYCVIPHACRLCGGRLLRSDDVALIPRYRCANCGIYKDVDLRPKIPPSPQPRASHRLLCFCGARAPGGVKLSLRCIANPQPCIEAPDQIIATAVGLADLLAPDS